jgi:ribosomal protein S6--L-glutamate ligase/gamma-F420-2:alpha-L-glutamate ligase
MNGWLIYDKISAERNAWFIQRLITLAKEQGIMLTLKTDEDFSVLPDFALVRVIRPDINARLQKAGVRVFNNAKTAQIACDKFQTYLFCKECGIPVLPTAKEYHDEIGLPCVVKTVDGHGGAEVFLAQTQAEVVRLQGAYKNSIVQKRNQVVGEDMRVYAVDGEIVAGVLRTSQTDFRSNFSLGGQVRLASVDEQQKAIVKKLHEELRFDFVGVDFLPDGKGGWILNEIEDSAGARMLYALSQIDIAKLYIEQIKKVCAK